MTAQDAENVVGIQRIASFHHVPVKEGHTFLLAPGERVMSVEYNAEGGWFYAIVMQEFPNTPTGLTEGAPMAENLTQPAEYVLVGYFRFVPDGERGVTGEVVSKYTPDWAEDSTVPVYRRLGETKATRPKEAS